MNVIYCVTVPTIQKSWKWPNIATQYHAHIARRKKDAKLYIAKGNLNVDKANDSSQAGLQQWSPTLDLQMFLDYNSQKRSPPPLLARISGS